MQRPGSALSKLRIQQQNLQVNVTQKSIQKNTQTKRFRRSNIPFRTQETPNER